MRELYLDNGNSKFKFSDTTTKIIFNALDNGIPAELTADTKVRIKNESGYLLEVSASITNGQAVITSGQLAQLPVGSYLIELWDTANGGTAIYPSDGFLRLQINENVTGLSGGIVSSITVDDFVERFNDLSQQLKKEVDSAITSVELITPDKATDLDANSAKGNSLYRLLNFKGSTTVTANTPFGGVWQADAVCLLETIGQASMVGTIQLFITVADGSVYRRTYTTNGWTNWVLFGTDKLKSVAQVITPATSASFDFDSAEKNTVVRILLDQNSTLPAHAPFDKYPGGIGILETWGDGLGSIQKYTQVYKDMAQDTSIWYRYKGSSWYRWYKANDKPQEDPAPGKIKVEVGKGKQYETLKSGIESAMASKPAETEVIVYPGTYDLIEEFGEAYFEAITGGEMNGLMVGDGLTLTFLAGSHVKANYTGNNDAVMKGFSPFNSSRGDLYISGLDLECSNVRYGFHDEKASRPDPYRMHMIDCTIYMDNTKNTAWSPRQCIGGGLGEHGEILIGRCSFESKDISGGVVSYHNGNTEDCESSITIYDCYIGGSNRAFFGFGYRGASTKVTKINLTGNSWPTAPYVHPETQDEPNVNMALARVYNNELRN